MRLIKGQQTVPEALLRDKFRTGNNFNLVVKCWCEMLANYARIMWISVPGRGSVNGKGRGRENERVFVGYNGGLSREMTADGNRDGGR